VSVVTDRRLARTSAAYVRAVLTHLDVKLDPRMLDGLHAAERWARGEELAADEVARIRAEVEAAHRLPKPKGAEALLAMAAWSVANLLDPEDPAPELSAEGAAELCADALVDAGVTSSLEAARAWLAAAAPATPRAGFRTVTARIVVADVAAQVAFMRRTFAATGEYESNRPAEMRLGDSTVMVSASGEREPFAAFLYVYVHDADAAYRRALSAGAVAIEEPLHTPYGDRRATVRDPWGNVWQIAHVLA
jgi:PhnB protein